MSKAITSFCQSCETCLIFALKQQKKEFGLATDCSEAWEALVTDNFPFKGKFYLIVACRFSSYMVVREMENHSTTKSMVYPRPYTVIKVHIYKILDFCKSFNIKLTYSSAEHHSSNYAERCVQTVKQLQ